jgi:hypothetical protein
VREDIARFFSSQAWAAPVIFVLNASYSSLTTTSFGVFNCLPYEVAGATYLAQDLSVRCFDPLHNGFRALAGLLIAFFGIGFPLLFAALLWRNLLGSGHAAGFGHDGDRGLVKVRKHVNRCARERKRTIGHQYQAADDHQHAVAEAIFE